MTSYRDLLHFTAERAAAYLEVARQRRVTADAAAIEAMALLGGPLNPEPLDPRAVIQLLDDAGSPATVINSGGRFFGFVNGGALPASVAANWLAAAWDQNAALRIESPVASFIEDVARGWILELLGLPRAAMGFVTGATMANFTALLAARHRVLAEAGWDVERQGLFGAPPITVVVGDEVHASLLRALSMLGLGWDRVIRVPADDQGRMNPDHLPDVTGAAILCAQVGNVNTGASDPMDRLASWSRRHGAWLHVDGAFGLWAAASPSRRHLVSGVDLADSWATDCHKWLNVPYDCGLAIVRHEDALVQALRWSAAYLGQSDSHEPMQHTPEMSRRARGVDVWAALKSLGRQGVADLLDRTCGLALRFANELRQGGAEILNEVVLNQVLVSFGDDETTRGTIAAVQDAGVCWCSGTVWKGRAAMRISVSSWVTDDDDVTRSIASIRAAAAAVCGPR